MARKLVTLKSIDSITPIKNADKLEVAHIGGWTSVVKKGEFYEGQQVFYFETDSMLSLDKKPFEFLRSRGVKLQGGKEYHRLKAMKLRGVISDGLLLPFSIVNYFLPNSDSQSDKLFKIQESGGDFAELFGVIKYEDPILSKFNGKMEKFPSWIKRTEEERIQNLPELVRYIQQTNSFDDWYATEKIDGTSCTIWGRQTEDKFEYGVCSRNYSLISKDNIYWQIAQTPFIEYKGNKLSPIEYIKYKCSEGIKSLVLQGEIFGEGINNNPLKIKGIRMLLFNVYEDGKFVSEETLRHKFGELVCNWVPVHNIRLESNIESIITQPDRIKTLVSEADANCQIEGFVWRNRNNQFLRLSNEEYSDELIRASFKVVSNQFRLKK